MPAALSAAVRNSAFVLMCVVCCVLLCAGQLCANRGGVSTFFCLFLNAFPRNLLAASVYWAGPGFDPNDPEGINAGTDADSDP